MSETERRTVLQALNHWSTVQPEKKCWTFLDDKGDAVDSYTYQELDAATNALAHELLQTHHLKASDRVLLVFFPGLDFTVSLLACFKAGIIAVPVFPPDPRSLKKDLEHFVNIQQSCEATVVLTNSTYNFVKKVEGMKSFFSSAGKWPELKWIVVDDVLKKGKKNHELKTVHGDNTSEAIAFLQYTSGSTSIPKGVMITQSNLAHNLTLIIRELRANTETVNVSWLPQFHDMGLIGSYLGVVYCGGTGFYLSPISFLKNPVVWITSMSRYKGTHTQAPNFAYPLVTRKFREKMEIDAAFRSSMQQSPPSLDLSSLQHMINAAEPVDFTGIMGFYSEFMPYGLPANVVVPTYGLAEHTVFVCSGGRQVLTVTKASLEIGQIDINLQTELRGGMESGSFDETKQQRIVGCGYPGNGEGVDVRIVAHETNSEVEDLTVGEIWVSSDSKANGYWNMPDVTKEDFHATLVNNGQGNSTLQYLRTGDLGFMFQGELFICGRSKDLIIVRGTNHYPQDIEFTIEHAHPKELRPGCSAAFALSPKDNEMEKIVYVAEIRKGVSNLEALAKACRDIVTQHHGIGINIVCFVPQGEAKKTTSGKISRAKTRQCFLTNKLSLLYEIDFGENVAAARDSDEQFGGSTATNRSVGGYQKVHAEIPAEDGQGAKSSASSSANPLAKMQTKEEIRKKTVEELTQELELVLVYVAATGSAPLEAGLDPNTDLRSLGVDSATIAQFLGVLQNRYFCDVPETFIFSQYGTLSAMAEAVKEGNLTAEQQRINEGLAADTPSEDGAHPNRRPVAPVVQDDEPCCPWFYMCRRCC